MSALWCKFLDILPIHIHILARSRHIGSHYKLRDLQSHPGTITILVKCSHFGMACIILSGSLAALFIIFMIHFTTGTLKEKCYKTKVNVSIWSSYIFCFLSIIEYTKLNINKNGKYSYFKSMCRNTGKSVHLI